jgi:hypothetical protein
VDCSLFLVRRRLKERARRNKKEIAARERLERLFLGFERMVSDLIPCRLLSSVPVFP